VNRFNDGTIAAADEAMAALADTDALILDVRTNNGGSLSALYLANWFMSGSQPALTMMSRSQLARLGPNPDPARIAGPKVTGAYRLRQVAFAMLRHGMRATFWTEGRGEAGYTRPVAVLIGERTGSAAEGFAWMMKLGSNARLVGRVTSGALLRSDTFKLPYGWSVTLPVYGLWGPGGESFADRPARPDIAVDWTPQDLCAGRDPDIAAALDYLDR
jgi:carboxyl-terminal processing protease